ncbi:MAG: Lrp/AsnC family transcriptional regulator [Chloroflexi bacterium]|nr:MAG: Lrp/AsnC family transcriptional regulator [Chloroflexota bacterium]
MPIRLRRPPHSHERRARQRGAARERSREGAGQEGARAEGRVGQPGVEEAGSAPRGQEKEEGAPEASEVEEGKGSVVPLAPSVHDLIWVTGEYDVIAVCEAPDVNSIGSLIVDKIQKIDGVFKTITCLAVK